MSDSEQLMATIANLLAEKKALDVVTLNLQGITLVADYFIIGTGTSKTHLQALGRHVEESLKEEGIRPLRVEGYQEAKWLLLDYGGVVLHLFLPGERDFYNLERLWGDAETVDLPSEN